MERGDLRAGAKAARSPAMNRSADRLLHESAAVGSRGQGCPRSACRLMGWRGLREKRGQVHALHALRFRRAVAWNASRRDGLQQPARRPVLASGRLCVNGSSLDERGWLAAHPRRPRQFSPMLRPFSTPSRLCAGVPPRHGGILRAMESPGLLGLAWNRATRAPTFASARAAPAGEPAPPVGSGSGSHRAFTKRGGFP